MTSLTRAPYGTWESILKPQTLTRRRVMMSGLRLDGFDTYWVEHRLYEGGRHILLRRRSDGVTGEVLPLTPTSQLMDVRSKVNEYGGRAYAISEGLIVANHYRDDRVYKFDLNDPSRSLLPLTPALHGRYGDFELDTTRGLIYAVEELHQDDGVTTRLVAIPLDGSAARDASQIRVLSSDTDFVAAPALSPDGLGLAWISWNHPHMPWSQSALHVGLLSFSGELLKSRTLVDIPEVCVYEPRWSLKGDLLHVDDTSGWANLYRTEGFDFSKGDFTASDGRLRTRVVHPSAKAFSVPQWQLGAHTYENFSPEEIVCSWSTNGRRRLGLLNIESGELEEGITRWHPAGNVACVSGRIVFLADSEYSAPSIVQIFAGKTTVLRDSADLILHEREISEAESVSWRTSDGQVAYGYFYPPKNVNYISDTNELPPVIVNAHAGPTTAAQTGLSWEVQYWTNRGFAFFDVDYRGSTGHGKTYRDALNGRWGQLDSQDLIEGLEYLASRGLVDPDRAVVRGFSAGAFTAFNSLWQSEAFRAATLRSGFWDLSALRKKVSKFESHLVDQLLDQDTQAQVELSPVNHVDQISAAVLLIHGEEDTLTTVSQTKDFQQKLLAHGTDAELLTIPHTDHYLSSQEAVEKSFAAELKFYQRVLKISQ